MPQAFTIHVGPNPADTDSDGLRDAWEQIYWPSGGGLSASGDADQDGLTDLQELAFGLNPTVGDSRLQPAMNPEANYPTITLTKHPGATYEVQTGGTLLSGQPDSFSATTITVLIDSGSTLKVRDNFPIGTAAARFLRVKVTAAP